MFKLTKKPIYPSIDQTNDTPVSAPEVPPKSSKIKSWWGSKSRRARLVIVVLTVCFVSLCAVGTWYKFFRKDPVPPATAPQITQEKVVEEPKKPTTEKSTLTGNEVPTGTNASTPLTAVMLENSDEARPQSGLKEAGVVYEAITEGGITRFMALYQEAKPANIGPVRSVRSQFLEFLAPFDAPVAHVGGSEEALSIVRSGTFKDLDQFFNPDAYHRTNTRYAPHNMYTSRENLLELQKSKGWTTSNFTGFARKEPAKQTANASKIDLNISSYLFDVHYDYDATSNSYLRSEGGAPHNDQESGSQLSPNVVVALVMAHSYNGIYSVYQSQGTGTAFVFQDGVATKATWSKSSRDQQISLKDAEGKPLGLNPGQTWLTLVNSETDVTYTP